MKMYRWLGSIYPGNRRQFLTIIVGFLFLLSPVKAQEKSISIPFGEGYKFKLSQFWLERDNIPLQEDEVDTRERKSPSRAFFSSLILPGTGEAYVGEKTQSKIFLAIEVVAWGLVVANMINVNMRQDDYKNFAVQHAFVERSGKGDQYWIDIGKYDKIFEYNEQRIRERDIDALYPENRFWFWSWDNTENRFFYDSKRIETREIEQNRLYFFAAIALNHLVSAINALRLANSYNRKIDELSLKFNIDYNPMYNQFSLSLQKSF
jgi:hypothetical protein